MRRASTTTSTHPPQHCLHFHSGPLSSLLFYFFFFFYTFHFYRLATIFSSPFSHSLFSFRLCSTPRHIFSFPISELSAVLLFAQHTQVTHTHTPTWSTFISYFTHRPRHATSFVRTGDFLIFTLYIFLSLSLLVLSLFLRFPPPSHVFYDDLDDHDHHTHYFQPLLSLLLSQLFFTVFSVLHFTERTNDHHHHRETPHKGHYGPTAILPFLFLFSPHFLLLF